MNFQLTQSANIEGLEVVITVDTEFTDYFEDLNDFIMHGDTGASALEISDLKDSVMVTIESEITDKNFSEIIAKQDFNTYVTLMIETLEGDEEYELCNAFLKLKTEYNLLIDEK